MNRRQFLAGLLATTAPIPDLAFAKPHKWIVRTSIPAPAWRKLYMGMPINEVPDLFQETAGTLIYGTDEAPLTFKGFFARYDIKIPLGEVED